MLTGPNFICVRESNGKENPRCQSYFFLIHRITRKPPNPRFDGERAAARSAEHRDDPLKSIPTAQIRFCSRLPMTAREKLPAAVISCGGRRTVKQLRGRAGNIVNTVPGPLGQPSPRSQIGRCSPFAVLHPSSACSTWVLRSPDHNLPKIGSHCVPATAPCLYSRATL